MVAKVNIRRAEPNDLPRMGELGAALVATHHNFDPRRFLAPTPDLAGRYSSFLEEQQKRPEKILIVAERNSTIIGYAFSGAEGADYMALRGPAGVIYDLVVDANHRRQGIGRALLDATLRSLAGRGVPRVVLFTARRNETAQRLFEQLGFRSTMIEMTAELSSAGQASEQT